jgi:GTPase involved in cell partitioning and DNA repair
MHTSRLREYRFTTGGPQVGDGTRGGFKIVREVTRELSFFHNSDINMLIILLKMF